MNTRRTALCLTLAVAIGIGVAPVATAADDHIDSAPATVYEAGEMSPQNMDYDATNQMFKAHPGWLNGQLIHYYKFRMYTPMTYPTKVPMGASPEIPIAPLYLLSTDGTFAGIPADAKPVIRYHTADGEAYSDFVRVHWVDVSGNVDVSTIKSFGDLEEKGLVATPSDIIVNMPVVPTGSTLEDPAAMGSAAPIRPTMVWYKGVEVQTFVFETTSHAFADHYNPITRDGAAAEAGSGYEIVVSAYATPDRVSVAPIWHINQYFTGVEPGHNSGGPAHMGQRNVINVDRLDAGYSPLWQVFWLTQLPPGYPADAVTDAKAFTPANGFSVMPTPMYVNCPNIGPHGGNPPDIDTPTLPAETAMLATGQVLRVEGALVMEADKEVALFHGGAHKIGATMSGMMGAFAFEIGYDDLMNEGVNEFVAKNAAGDTVARWSVERVPPAPSGTDGGALDDGDHDDGAGHDEAPGSTPGAGVVLVLGVLAAAALVGLRRRA